MAQSARVIKLMEELNLKLSPDELIPLGEFVDVAENEPDHALIGLIFNTERTFQDI